MSIIHSAAKPPLTTALPPIIPPAPGLLLLGSSPSLASIEARRYYAHPRNAFWSILAALGDTTPPDSIEGQRQLCARLGIALWDVLASCERAGSADAAIVRATERPNDIAALLAENSKIAAIGLNGQRAQACFARHIRLPDKNRPKIFHLPSTSPANARMHFADKLAAWRVLEAFLKSRAAAAVPPEW